MDTFEEDFKRVSDWLAADPLSKEVLNAIQQTQQKPENNPQCNAGSTDGALKALDMLFA